MINNIEPTQKDRKNSQDLPHKREDDQPIKLPGANEEEAAEFADNKGENSRRGKKDKAEDKNEEVHIYHPFDGIF